MTKKSEISRSRYKCEKCIATFSLEPTPSKTNSTSFECCLMLLALSFAFSLFLHLSGNALFCICNMHDGVNNLWGARWINIIPWNLYTIWLLNYSNSHNIQNKTRKSVFAVCYLFLISNMEIWCLLHSCRMNKHTNQSTPFSQNIIFSVDQNKFFMFVESNFGSAFLANFQISHTPAHRNFCRFVLKIGIEFTVGEVR